MKTFFENSKFGVSEMGAFLLHLSQNSTIHLFVDLEFLCPLLKASCAMLQYMLLK